MFVSDVAKARGLDFNNSSVFADAHVFSAQRAMSVGLIDALGTLYDAKKEVEKMSKVMLPVWNSESKVDKLLRRVVGESATKIYALFSGLKAYW